MTLAEIIANASDVRTYYTITVATADEARAILAALASADGRIGHVHQVDYCTAGNVQWWQGWASFDGHVGVTVSTPHVPIQAPEFVGGHQ